MIPYFEKFPEKRSTELRTTRFLEGNENASIPCGTYVFTEYYCGDLTCNCQRVLIKVLRVADPEYWPEEVATAPPKEIATISFTWSDELDEGWEDILEDVDNPFLDPFHFQDRCAEAMMDFWYDMYQNDSDYADRLQRHYWELRHLSGTAGTPQGADLRFIATSEEKAEEMRKRRRLLQRRNVKPKSRRKGS
ncbi:MAG: hypothetical protein EA381_00020 [Planctomycetaceae bacterium]|nr:MAG: hypothetical protein EA381_00020 [Planctomycetaceae bacterium]